MVLPDSHKITRVSWYLVASQERKNFVYRTITVYGLTFQTVQLHSSFVTLWCIGSCTVEVPQPHTYNAYHYK